MCHGPDMAPLLAAAPVAPAGHLSPGCAIGGRSRPLSNRTRCRGRLANMTRHYSSQATQHPKTNISPSSRSRAPLPASQHSAARPAAAWSAGGLSCWRYPGTECGSLGCPHPANTASRGGGWCGDSSTGDERRRSDTAVAGKEETRGALLTCGNRPAIISGPEQEGLWKAHHSYHSTPPHYCWARQRHVREVAAVSQDCPALKPRHLADLDIAQPTPSRPTPSLARDCWTELPLPRSASRRDARRQLRPGAASSLRQGEQGRRAHRPEHDGERLAHSHGSGSAANTGEPASRKTGGGDPHPLAARAPPPPPLLFPYRYCSSCFVCISPPHCNGLLFTRSISVTREAAIAVAINHGCCRPPRTAAARWACLTITTLPLLPLLCRRVSCATGCSTHLMAAIWCSTTTCGPGS